MITYTDSRLVKGADLKIGDWLDTLDRGGARAIFGIFAGMGPDNRGTPTAERLQALRCNDINSGYRTIMVGGGETETVRVDVDYSVVNPDTMVEIPDPPQYVEYKLITITGPLDPGEYRALTNGRFRLACIDCGDVFEVATMDVLDPTPEHPCRADFDDLDAV